MYIYHAIIQPFHLFANIYGVDVSVAFYLPQIHLARPLHIHLAWPAAD